MALRGETTTMQPLLSKAKRPPPKKATAKNWEAMEMTADKKKESQDSRGQAEGGARPRRK